MTKPLPPGRVLLNRLLTPKQRADLDKLGHFDENGVTITIANNGPGRPGYVYTGACLRIVGRRDLPVYDQAIAFLLLVRVGGYSSVANRDVTWPPRRPFFGSRW